MNQLSQIIARDVPGFSTVGRMTEIRTNAADVEALRFIITEWKAVDCVIIAPRTVTVEACCESSFDPGTFENYAVKHFTSDNARRDAMEWIETQLPF